MEVQPAAKISKLDELQDLGTRLRTLLTRAHELKSDPNNNEYQYIKSEIWTLIGKRDLILNGG